MGLLGKVKNKVHQGLLGAKDAYVKLNEFIADHGQFLPYAIGAMAPYMWNIHPIAGIQFAVNAIAMRKFFENYNEMKKQEKPSDSYDIYKSYNKRNYEVIPANKIIDDSETQRSANQNNYMARKPIQE